MDKKTTYGLKPEQLGRLLSISTNGAKSVEAKSKDKTNEKESTSSKSPPLQEQESRLHDEGPQIEDYEILGKIGEAGQGQIWCALQISTGREVALKVPRIGLISSEKVLSRFEREIEVAAKLKHPNIARIHDSGIHHGMYYYAMDLIEGMHLDEYVKERNLTIRQILELMKVICQSVQYAHQSGVIHRDLKPSNIIVTRDGQPYIVDFGLAKYLFEDDPAITVSTDGEAPGTPAYMSPEQAAGHTDKLDTRTDVYSLGVILFTLLTGSNPHDLSGTRLEVLRRIADKEVIRPCTLNHKIDKDIEALLLKALDIDPDKRYSSAGGLAEDIDNYLKGEPLIAGPPGILYRLRKSVRRHKAAVAAVTAVGVALIAGLIVSTAMYFRAEGALYEEARARAEADKASQEAKQATEEAKQAANNEVVARVNLQRANAEAQTIVEFLTQDILGHANQVKGRDATVIDILDVATAKLDNGTFEDQPLVEVSVRLKLAWLYDDLGFERKAMLHRERICQLGNEKNAILPGTEPGTIMNSLACCYERAGEYKKAELLFKELIEREMGLHNWCRSNLAVTYLKQGRYEEAQHIFLEVMNIPWWEEKVAAGYPYLVNYVVGLAETYQAQGLYEDAEGTFRRAFALASKLRPYVQVRNKSKLARLYILQGRYQEAEELFLEAMEIGQRALPGLRHPDTLHVMNGLAILRTKQGDYDKAAHLFQEVLEGRKEKLGDEHPETLETINNIGVLHCEQYHFDEAEPLLIQALEGRRLKLGDTHPHTIESINNLIDLYEAWNEPEKADQWRAKLPQRTLP